MASTILPSFPYATPRVESDNTVASMSSVLDNFAVHELIISMRFRDRIIYTGDGVTILSG